MSDDKKETLADLFLSIAADHGVSRDDAVAFFSAPGRKDVFEAAQAMPISTASALIGQPAERMERMIRHDIERLFPRAQ